MSKTTNTQYAPDLAKAIGILLVVFGHVLRGLMNAGIVQTTGFWLEVDRLIYLFHMPLFFFLSGIFFEETLNRRGYGATILRNVTALLIPLVFWSYLQFGLQYVAAGSTNISLSLDDVLTAPFPPRQQFWFLWALFQVTVVVGAVMQLSKSTWVLGALALVSVILNLLGFGEVGSRTLGSDLVRNLPYFLIGAMGFVPILSGYRIGNLAALSIFLLSMFFYAVFEHPAEIIRLVTSTICLLAIYKIAANLTEFSSTRKIDHFNRILIFVGMNSMIIYLAHVIFEAGFRAFLVKLGVVDIAAHLIGGLFIGMTAPLCLVPIGLAGMKLFPRVVPAILPVRSQRN